MPAHVVHHQPSIPQPLEALSLGKGLALSKSGKKKVKHQTQLFVQVESTISWVMRVSTKVVKTIHPHLLQLPVAAFLFRLQSSWILKCPKKKYALTITWPQTVGIRCKLDPCICGQICDSFASTEIHASSSVRHNKLMTYYTWLSATASVSTCWEEGLNLLFLMRRYKILTPWWLDCPLMPNGCWGIKGAF